MVLRALLRPVLREPLRSPFVRRGGGWTPAALFTAGQQGFWLDPSDFTTMFQDSAGTTPVTAVGQPVGKILDKSGRANHFAQGTTASRPILQQDVSGFYCLAFDGVDDFLSSVSVASIGAATTHSSAIRWAGASSTGNVFCNSGATPQLSGVTLGPIYRMFAATTLSGGVTDTNNHVFTAQFVGASSALVVDKVGVAAGAAGSNGMTGTTVRVGCDGAGSSQFFNGRFYGGVIADYVLTTPQRTTLETYLGGKAGLAL